MESLNTSGPANSSRPKLWTRDFIGGTLVNFFLMVNYFSLMVVVTDYAMSTFSASASMGGFVASVFIVSALAARLASGGLIERIGRKRLLLAGAALEVLFSCSYFWTDGIVSLLIVRILHGFCYGMCSTAIGTIVTSLVPKDRKGEGIGYYMLSVTLGAAIGPFIGITLMQTMGFVSIFVVSAITAVLCLACAIVLKVPEIEKTNDASAHHTFFLRSLLEVRVVPISVVAALIYLGYSSILTFLKPFADEVGLQIAASVFFVVYAAAMFVTRPLTGKLYDRFGQRFAMIPAFISFMIGMMMLGLSQNSFMMLTSAAFLGFGVGTIQACGLTIAVQKVSRNQIGLANSTFYIFLDLGVGLGPTLLGLLVPEVGYAGLFITMVVLAACALIFYLFISRKTSEYI